MHAKVLCEFPSDIGLHQLTHKCKAVVWAVFWGLISSKYMTNGCCKNALDSMEQNYIRIYPTHKSASDFLLKPQSLADHVSFILAEAVITHRSPLPSEQHLNTT